MAKVYGYWKCDICNTVDIKGDKTHCPNCGTPRNNNTEFYLTQKKEYVEAEKENNEPDWLCEYCGSLTSGKSNICANCGSSRDGTNKDYFQLQEEKEQSEQSVNEDYSTTEGESEDISTVEERNVKSEQASYNSSLHTDVYSYDNYSSETKRSIFGKIFDFFRDLFIEISLNFYRITDFFKEKAVLILGIVLAILAVIVGIYVFSPVTENVNVDSLAWERSIEIEEYKTFNESDWSLPNDARLQRTASEIQYYEDVFDHYETETEEVAKTRIVGYEEKVVDYKDLGNGQFEEIISSEPIYEKYYETRTYQKKVYRQEAVYATKYYYEIDRWVFQKDIVTSGENNTPYWGEVSLNDRQREGDREEEFFIVYNGENFIVTKDIWNGLDIDDKVSITYTNKFRKNIKDISIN